MTAMISDGQGRMVPEWIGKSADSRPPERVMLRIMRRHQGRCYLTGREIRPGDAWQMDHVVAIINGGENRESNLAPALQTEDGHKGKTKRDVALKAKNDARAKAHWGIKSAPRRKIQSRGFPEVVRERKRLTKTLPKSKLFVDCV